MDRTIGPYRVVRELGRGMVGEVFEGASGTRRVVIKSLRADVAARSSSIVTRFAREARVLAEIHHPNVMPVIEVREDADMPFYVMPFVEGQTLAESLRARSQPPITRALAILRDIALALAEVHRRGLVHRDVKPANVFLKATGEALLFDFGLVKDTAKTDVAGLTRDGEVLGTPAYMAPEQIKGEVVSGKTDVYSLAVTIVEMLLGRNPYACSDVIECCRRHLFGSPKRLDHAIPHRVSRDLGVLVARALDKSPEARPDAREIAQALGRELERVCSTMSQSTRESARPLAPFASKTS